MKSLFERRRPADVDPSDARERAAVGAQAVDERVHAVALGVVPRRHHEQRRAPVGRGARRRDARDLGIAAEPGGIGPQRGSVAGVRHAARVELGDHLRGPGRAGAELPSGELGAHAGLVGLGELAQRAVPEIERERGQRQRDQHGGARERRDPGPPCHPQRPALPEPRSGRRAGRGRAAAAPPPALEGREVRERACDPAALVDAPSEQPHEDRQQRHGGEDRYGDHDDGSHRHRPDRGRVDEPQAGEREDHRDAGERDGEP